MAKVEAVQCDACDHIEVPSDGATIPYSWLLVDIDQEGDGALLRGAVYCSWACLVDVAQHRAAPAPKVKRKRRTRAEIEADAKARRPAPAPSPAASV